MIYRDFKGKKLSALGMGTMRLPCREDKTIDVERTREMVDYAIKNGVNYFDTAWGYHEGTSESVIGEILSAYPRESFYLATKFPGYSVDNFPKCQEIFYEQLKKLKTDYFDFYLLHCIAESNIEAYLDEKYGIFPFLLEQKRIGKIKHIGFSVHASLETTKRFLDKWGEHIEFCQVQLNYLDYTFQNAKAKLNLLKSLDIPVWVMEPVRGGSLAVLDDEYMSRLKALRPDESAPAWAFRFIQSIPEVVMTLSGMSNFEQMSENVRIFSEDKPVNDKEKKVLFDIAHDMVKKIAQPCTACRYCTQYCPKGLDIPSLLSLYNEHAFTGDDGFISPAVLEKVDLDKRPNNCIGCKSCEKVCPQEIKISKVMTDFTARIR